MAVLERPFMLLVALLIDAVVGEPKWLWRRWPHPVVVTGSIIDRLDRLLNRPVFGAKLRRWTGVLALGILLFVAFFAGYLLASLTGLVPFFGKFLQAVIASVLIAQRSLYEHVSAVAGSFTGGGLPAARRAVAKIVGRDPAKLDEAGVCRAAIESLGENLSDSVIAPAFWFLVAGLPGLFVYKALNTADSMIGHKTDHYVDFGRAAARLDDTANWVPARATGWLLCAAALVSGANAAHARRILLKDAGRHRSPSAGWPEAAMAGALGLALAGPRIYGGALIQDAWMNETGRRDARPEDIRRALRLAVAALVLQALAVAVLALMLSF